MLIGGLQKTTLIDFPGRVAATIFTIGCNFRCPFCHNKDLVSVKNFEKSSFNYISENDIFKFLETRKGILDGVCITGGEPTIQKDLINFCQKLKKLGLEVKLDTNGTRPKLVVELLKKNLVDYIAMDVKNNFDSYQSAVGTKINIEKIVESIKKISQSKIEFELRITIVPGIHKKNNLEKLAAELKDIDDRLFLVLQNFQPENCLDSSLCKKKPFSILEMGQMLKAVRKVLPESRIRGDV
jgi:pyruvate formate lyase activating enzyme